MPRGAMLRGAYVPLAEQDAAPWDAGMIEEAEALLLRASAMGVIGRYQLEAAVQSAHAARRITGRTDWAAIERLYQALIAITDSPVVAINRAVALAETRGAAAGLAISMRWRRTSGWRTYQPYWAARAELLARHGASGSSRAGLPVRDRISKPIRRCARSCNGSGRGWPSDQFSRARAIADSRSAANTMTKITISSSETSRYWNRFIAVSSSNPMPPAPTKPSTSDERMFSSSRYSPMPSKRRQHRSAPRHG